MPPKGSLKVSGSGLLEKKQSVDAVPLAPGNAPDAAPPVEGAANAPVVEEGPPVDEELAMLQKKAEAGKAELVKLKQMLDVLMEAQCQDVREAKILELFKKNVALAKSYERERLLSARLKHDFSYLQQELAKLKLEEAQMAPDVPTEKELEKEIQESNIWKEKYNQATAKFMEAQGAKSVLSAEISRLQHALQREVGDHISLSKVLEEGQYWKGRAQQISLLKDKITELEAKVQQQASDDYQGSEFDAKENACKKQIDELAQNFVATRDELGKIKQKVDCVIARRNILETEMKNAKERMGLLMSKSDSDDLLIAALRQEIEASKQAVSPEKTKERINCPLRIGSLHREHQLAASFNDLKLHCREQVLQIKAQTELIQYLRDITAASREEQASETEMRKSS